MLFLAVVLSLQAEEIKHPWHGEFKDDYKDPKTKALVMHYRMRVPDKLPERNTLGLIVAFHGMNGNEDHMTGFALMCPLCGRRWAGVKPSFDRTKKTDRAVE